MAAFDLGILTFSLRAPDQMPRAVTTLMKASTTSVSYWMPFALMTSAEA